MKTKLGFALLLAALLHAALFSTMALLPRAPNPPSDADFVAEVPFFDEAWSLPDPALETRIILWTPIETFTEPSPVRVGFATCPVHHTDMAVLETTVSVDRQGQAIDPPGLHLSNPHDPPGAFRAAQFPNARSWAWVDGAGSPNKARIYVCKECERAEEAWKSASGK